ncbi:MAG TPA: OadG family protein [Selenomonadales bacterium]|nr:OadG family protein [Selenomonadales bacterium]
MTWLGIIAALAVVAYFFRGHQAKAMPAATAKSVYEDPAADTEEELFAVIAAAIAEFEGDGEFQVVSIRRRSRSWALFGRAELMRNRL